jgi:hypothetical protein
VIEDHVAAGHMAQAMDFAARAFAPPQLAWVRDDLQDGQLDGAGHAQFLASVVFARELVKGLSTAPVDYVNFHWYIDDEPALGEALDYLARATGKPLVTTEIGQGLIDGAIVTSHLQRLVVERRLPFVIWYDAEGSGGARALHDAGPPPVLRPNGVAFAQFVHDHTSLLE